jgi:hypothetical protein
MSELDISAALVGQDVCNPARPEWGVGKVLRVQSTSAGGVVRHRVSVQFATGHRTLQIPPGRLVLPEALAARPEGWLDRAGGTDLDARLRALPDFVREFLGTPRQRLLMQAPLFARDETPANLVKWAREQTRVADPLSRWTRDELQAAFAEFRTRRDHLLRATAGEVRRAGGPEAVTRALATLESPLRERMETVLAAGG